ncbi:chemotaxis protein CheA [Psychrobacter frigidicola]|uniref:Chemotaxis protein CheA n=1 Tax=Psychrobacter frigidicola TaxID=45611 RepID=A0A5C7A1L1_9GAMM|nr:ATP-binding protein [Psychrobacter frigidicola]TXD97126.1 chemotaxis protein CheA [Psychrobacter frigidicola]
MEVPSRSSSEIPQSRYTAIIVSVVIFLLLTSGVLITSIYNSLKIRDLRAGTALSANLRSDIPRLTQEIYLLNIMRAQEQPTPALDLQVDKITQLTEQVDKVVTTLTEGGKVTIRSDEDVYKPSTQSDQVEYVQGTLNLWTPYKEEAISFVNAESAVEASDLENRFGQATQGIYDNATGLTDSISTENGNRAGFLRNLQIFGISFAIIYFIIFVLYFVRRLKASDEELISARRETQEIMETVSTGLFLLDKDLNIGQQYSRALTKIIGADKLAGENFANVLRGRISDKDLTTTRQFIEQLYNPRVKERLVDSLNPLHKVMLHDTSADQGTDSRFLDFKFSRVYENKEIARILVNVNDVSDAVYLEQRLEKESAQNDMQIEMLTTILNVNPKVINEFIANTKSHIDKMNNVLKNPGSSQFELEGKLNAIYREMHSLKGEASALKLHSFTKISSDAEDKLSALQNQGKLSGNDFLPLAVHLDELLSLSNTIETLGARINQGAPVPVSSVQSTTVPVTIDAPVVLAAATNPSVNRTLDSADSMDTGLSNRINAQDTSDAHLLPFYQNFVTEIAARQGKRVQLNGDSLSHVVIPAHLKKAVKDISIQLLRNAVVHGIEDINTRTAVGKPATGVINLELKNEGQNVIMTLQDDGQGINFESIRDKLVTMGRFSAEDASKIERNELLRQLFSSGFSTRDSADEDGGRGVGLDIIKAQVKEYDGKLNVNSEFGKMTRFVITLPAA